MRRATQGRGGRRVQAEWETTRHDDHTHITHTRTILQQIRHTCQHALVQRRWNSDSLEFAITFGTSLEYCEKLHPRQCLLRCRGAQLVYAIAQVQPKISDHMHTRRTTHTHTTARLVIGSLGRLELLSDPCTLTAAATNTEPVVRGRAFGSGHLSVRVAKSTSLRSLQIQNVLGIHVRL
jgi:hypothetical protein